MMRDEKNRETVEVEAHGPITTHHAIEDDLVPFSILYVFPEFVSDLIYQQQKTKIPIK